MDNVFEKVFPSSTSVFTRVKKATVLNVKAHSITLQNDGETTVNISGFKPIVPGGFLIIDDFGDVRVYHNEVFDISFIGTGTNKLIVYVQKIKGFPYC